MFFLLKHNMFMYFCFMKTNLFTCKQQPCYFEAEQKLESTGGPLWTMLLPQRWFGKHMYTWLFSVHGMIVAAQWAAFFRDSLRFHLTRRRFCCARLTWAKRSIWSMQGLSRIPSCESFVSHRKFNLRVVFQQRWTCSVTRSMYCWHVINEAAAHWAAACSNLCMVS